jgi:cytochrome c-type biogenesis protein CcmE
LALVLAVGAIVLYQGLSSATMFFCNADEIGRKESCSGNGRLRLQGVVDNGSLVEDAGVLRFTVSYGGATVPVTYRGDPGGIFREGIPVVVEGRMGDTAFAGDRILVKHTEQYVEENPGRVPEGAP